MKQGKDNEAMEWGEEGYHGTRGQSDHNGTWKSNSSNHQQEDKAVVASSNETISSEVKDGKWLSV